MSRSVPAHILRAIRNLVDYNRQAELRDWEEQGRPDFHVYTDIRLLDVWLDGMEAADEELTTNEGH